MLLEAVELTFEGMPWLRSADTAAMELAREYAAAIDNSPDPVKALFLGPHLLNCLTALGGSPAGRRAMQDSTPVGGALASIRAGLPGFKANRQDDASDLDAPAG